MTAHDVLHRPYDGCFIFFGDVRYDSRLQNILRSLSKKYAHLLLLQTSQQSDVFEFEACTVVSSAVNESRRGVTKFSEFYAAVLPKALRVKAPFFCAEDVFSLPVARIAASGKRSQVLYDSRELFYALASLHQKPAKQKIWAGLERFFIQHATVFTSGDLDSDLLAAHYSIPRPEVIYNYPRLQTVPRTDALHRRLGIEKNKIILLYQGMMSEGRGIYPALDALKNLGDRFVLVFIGDGEILSDLRREIENPDLRNRAFALGRVPYSELLNLTASADIGLSLIENLSKSFELALPNKLFEYTLCEVPSVVSDLPAMKAVIDAHGIGVAVDVSNLKEIVSGIETVARGREKFAAACGTARLLLNWQAQEERLLKIF